jgi:DNA-binding NtrC family response regulator
MHKSFQHILLIDDDASLNRVLSVQLEEMGFSVTSIMNGASGIAAFKTGQFDIVVTNLQLPDMSGLDVLNEIRRRNSHVIIVMITAYGTVENAVQACKQGANDYITKPFGKETLRFTLEKAIRLQALQSENQQLRTELLTTYDFSKIVGKSAAMKHVLTMAGRVAESDATTLILGESGTGKELVARGIHYNSSRKNNAFITVNCPSIPDALIESELFGHVKGAFTGALKDRMGKFQMAHHGTIFLDEIGDLKAELQAKLLRVLQEREIERVGEAKPFPVDVRVIAATNRDLLLLVASGQFREDLFYRLNVVTILIPALRERRDDIPFLVDNFILKYGKGQRFHVHPDALTLPQDYSWPGNVRELENAVERAIVLSTSTEITPELLPPTIHARPSKPSAAAQVDYLHPNTLEEIERIAIENALQQADGNQTKAAQLLDIPRHVLLYRMKKLEI